MPTDLHRRLLIYIVACCVLNACRDRSRIASEIEAGGGIVLDRAGALAGT